MGSIVSMHIFLEEHLHPALDKTTGNVCATLWAGWIFMVCSAVFVLVSTLFYAARFAPNKGDRAKAWPPHVAARLRSTYIYYTSSVVIAAVSIATVAQIPVVLAFMSDYSLATVVCCLLAKVTTGHIVQAIPYSEGFGVKQVAFAIHSAIIGIAFAPVCVLGNAVMVKAARLTAATVGILAVFVPPYSTPMNCFLFSKLFYVIASLIGVFWATSTETGAHSYALNLYVGLVWVADSISSHFADLVLDLNPTEQEVKADPISKSISILAHTLSMFMRIAILLVGGGNGKLKGVC